MVGDKEVSSNCSERLPVQPDTPEYSSIEIVTESARRQSTLIPQVKRMVQPLISVVAKRMKFSSKLYKTKRDQDEPDEPCKKTGARKHTPTPQKA